MTMFDSARLRSRDRAISEILVKERALVPAGVVVAAADARFRAAHSCLWIFVFALPYRAFLG